MAQQDNSVIPVYHGFIKSLEHDFAKLSAANECDLVFQQEAQFAIQILDEKEYTRKIAIQNPKSLRNALMNIAAIGLTLNPAEKKAYLVPRDGMICLDVSYIGMVDIACQSDSIDFVQAKIVHRNDSFEVRGVNETPIHNFNPFGDRGQKVGVYCVAKTSNNDFLTEIMTLDECYAIRERSPSWSRTGKGPWLTDESEMMKKTVIKRASKLWPKTKQSIRLDAAIAAMNQYEGITFDDGITEEQKRAAYDVKKEERKKELKEKDDLISEITDICSDICKNKTAQEKVEFVSKNIDPNGFKHLRNKSNEQLKEIIDKLYRNN